MHGLIRQVSALQTYQYARMFRINKSIFASTHILHFRGGPLAACGASIS